MRIRKNHKAEVREFLFPELPAGEPLPPAYDCKVNRSPWDIPRGQDPFAYTLPLPPLPPPHIVRDAAWSKNREGEYDDPMGATSVKGNADGEREGSEVDERGKETEKHRSDDNWEIRDKGKDTLKYYRRCRKKPLAEVAEEKEKEKADTWPPPRRSQRSTAGSNPDDEQYYYYYSRFGRRRGKSTRNGGPSGNNKDNEREDDKGEAPLDREMLEEAEIVVAEEKKEHDTEVDDEDDCPDEDNETTEADTENSEKSDGHGDESIGNSFEGGMDEDDRYWLYGITK